MPSRADIDPVENPHLLPNLLLISVRHEPLDFYYRLIGTEIDRHSIQPNSWKWVSEIPHNAAPSRIFSTYKTVVETRAPTDRELPYVGPMKDFKHVHHVMMPLSDDGETVSMLFGAVDFVPD